ncbi:hypothetical protein ACFL54_00200 [Planctomycetota bacterium]
MALVGILPLNSGFGNTATNDNDGNSVPEAPDQRLKPEAQDEKPEFQIVGVYVNDKDKSKSAVFIEDKQTKIQMFYYLGDQYHGLIISAINTESVELTRSNGKMVTIPLSSKNKNEIANLLTPDFIRKMKKRPVRGYSDNNSPRHNSLVVCPYLDTYPKCGYQEWFPNMRERMTKPFSSQDELYLTFFLTRTFKTFRDSLTLVDYYRVGNTFVGKIDAKFWTGNLAKINQRRTDRYSLMRIPLNKLAPGNYTASFEVNFSNDDTGPNKINLPETFSISTSFSVEQGIGGLILSVKPSKEIFVFNERIDFELTFKNIGNDVIALCKPLLRNGFNLSLGYKASDSANWMRPTFHNGSFDPIKQGDTELNRQSFIDVMPNSEYRYILKGLDSWTKRNRLPLVPGNYFIKLSYQNKINTFNDEGGKTVLDSAWTGNILSNEGASVEFAVQPKKQFVLTGVLTNDKGEMIPAACIEAFDSEDRLIARCWTGPNTQLGHYRFSLNRTVAYLQVGITHGVEAKENEGWLPILKKGPWSADATINFDTRTETFVIEGKVIDENGNPYSSWPSKGYAKVMVRFNSHPDKGGHVVSLNKKGVFRMRTGQDMVEVRVVKQWGEDCREMPCMREKSLSKISGPFTKDIVLEPITINRKDTLKPKPKKKGGVERYRGKR